MKCDGIILEIPANVLVKIINNKSFNNILTKVITKRKSYRSIRSLTKYSTYEES